MIQKYFALDKNYLLEEAQLSLQSTLIPYLVDFAKSYYLQTYNPLGLEDDTTIKIAIHRTEYTERLEEFYMNLSAVYRYKYGENQLEFLFDGNDHTNKYKSDWIEAYKKWVLQFCQSPNFLRAVLELTVFYPEGRKSELAENRMKAFINQQFDLKIYKYRGIVEMKVA